MRTLLLQPHPDDAVLFAAFTLLRHRPQVVTVLWPNGQESRSPSLRAGVRMLENEKAIALLGCEHEQWDYREDDPPWETIRDRLLSLEHLDASTPLYDHVFAPAVEDEGHDHHNRIGQMAREVFGADRVTGYLTYTRPRGKSRATRSRNPVWPVEGVEVAYEPAWVTLKLRALACYRSQIETAEAGCTPHFVQDLAEYHAA